MNDVRPYEQSAFSKKIDYGLYSNAYKGLCSYCNKEALWMLIKSKGSNKALCHDHALKYLKEMDDL